MIIRLKGFNNHISIISFLFVIALALGLSSSTVFATPPTGDGKVFVFDSSLITAFDDTNPFTGVYIVAPNGSGDLPAAASYYYRPGGPAEDIATNTVAATTGTPPMGASSWRSTNVPPGVGKIEVLIHPDEIFGGSYTLADIQNLSWHTNKAGAIGDPDWYVNIWLDASSDSDGNATNDVAFLSGEPYWSSNNAGYAANTWTNWVADDAAGGAYEINFEEPGYACTAFGWAAPANTMPSLDELTGGAYTWLSVPRNSIGAFGCPGTAPVAITNSIDYSVMPILGISIATGSGWADGFQGYVDEFVIELDDGGGNTDRITVDFEANSLPAEPVIYKSFSPASINPGGTSVLGLALQNTNAIPMAEVDFTDTLPTGILIVAPIVNTCGGTLTAAAGTGVISLADGYIDEAAICYVQVLVTAASAGTYTNTTGALTTDTLNNAFGGAGGGTSTASDILNVAANVGVQTIVVTSVDTQGWTLGTYGTPSNQGFELGPDTPPLGTGSFFSEISVSNSKTIPVRTNAEYSGHPLSSLQALSFDSYNDVTGGSTSNKNWYLSLYLSANGDPFYDCRINYSTVYAAGNIWETFDAFNGTWNSSGAGCSGFSGTIAAFLGLHPSAVLNAFSNPNEPAIRFNQGDTASSYVGYIGNIDNIRISQTVIGDITWDFEPYIPPTGGGSSDDDSSTSTTTTTDNGDIAQAQNDNDYIIKRVNGGESTIAALGDTVTFTITSSNPTSDTINATITDTLDSHLTDVVIVSNTLGNASLNGNTLTITDVVLGSGTSSTITLTATIASSAQAGDTITNLAQLSYNPTFTSNTVSILVLPDTLTLPSTGESQGGLMSYWWVMMVGLILMMGLFVIGRNQRA